MWNMAYDRCGQAFLFRRNGEVEDYEVMPLRSTCRVRCPGFPPSFFFLQAVFCTTLETWIHGGSS